MTAPSSPHNFEHLLPHSWQQTITEWLAEDTPSFDYGGFVVGDAPTLAILFAKAEGILAGVPFFNEVFRQVNCTVVWHLPEGANLHPAPAARLKVATVTGPARNILQGERVALNILARASGIATRARRLQAIKERKGWAGVIAGTRKTTPGFRLVEKYSMLVGGVDPHRMDLSSMIMLKDNHIWATGSITQAIQKARVAGGFSLKIEVECGNEAEADEAIAAGADIVMLDNFDGGQAGVAAKALRERWPGKSFLVEGSGGLTEENAEGYMAPDVNILSFGSLSQSVPHIDFSLKVQPAKK